MKRYYKTLKSSKTGLNIRALLDIADEFNMQVEALRNKYGFNRVGSSLLFYKFISIVEFEENPDATVWEKSKTDNGYYPILNCRNKEILQDFLDANKNAIRRDEFDTIIGNKEVFAQAAFYFNIPEVYVFIVGDDWNCKVPKDCEEISNIEYSKLITE